MERDWAKILALHFERKPYADDCDILLSAPANSNTLNELEKTIGFENGGAECCL